MPPPALYTCVTSLSLEPSPEEPAALSAALAPLVRLRCLELNTADPAALGAEVASRLTELDASDIGSDRTLAALLAKCSTLTSLTASLRLRDALLRPHVRLTRLRKLHYRGYRSGLSFRAGIQHVAQLLPRFPALCDICIPTARTFSSTDA